jgi:hypothetical protein
LHTFDYEGLFEHILLYLFPGNVGPPSTLLATAAGCHPWPALLMPDANTVALYSTAAALVKELLYAPAATRLQSLM